MSEGFRQIIAESEANGENKLSTLFKALKMPEERTMHSKLHQTPNIVRSCMRNSESNKVPV